MNFDFEILRVDYDNAFDYSTRLPLNRQYINLVFMSDQRAYLCFLYH